MLNISTMEDLLILYLVDKEAVTKFSSDAVPEPFLDELVLETRRLMKEMHIKSERVGQRDER